MKQKVLFLVMTLGCALWASGSNQVAQKPVGSVKYVAKNAVRIRFSSGVAEHQLPDWMYVKHDEETRPEISASIEGDAVTVISWSRVLPRWLSTLRRMSTNLDSDSFRTAIAMCEVCRAG